MATALPSADNPDDGCGSYRGSPLRWGWWWLLPLFVVSALVILGVTVTLLGWVHAVPPGYGPTGYFWPLAPLGFFLFVFAGFLLLRWATWGGRGWAGGARGNSVSAREMLRWRFARGELSSEQFREMSRELDADSAR